MPFESIGVIAERYAAALFDLADAQGALDRVADDLSTLKSMILDSADLRRLLDSPALSRDEQGAAMAALAKAADFGEQTTNFLGLVARNRRLFALPAMIDCFRRQLAVRRSQVDADVVSAAPLTPVQLSALEGSLKTAFGGNVVVKAAVDPDLLGGMVVKVGSRMVDSSLRTKLQSLKLVMKGVG